MFTALSHNGVPGTRFSIRNYTRSRFRIKATIQRSVGFRRTAFGLILTAMGVYGQGDIVRVSVDSSNLQSNGSSDQLALSGNGRYVAFSSTASNLVLGDTNGKRDIFVRDLVTGTTTLISNGPGGAPSTADSFAPSISYDGRFIAFASDAPLVSYDINGVRDIYLYDMQTGSTTFVSNDMYGSGGGNGVSYCPAISRDGRWVAFYSFASNLVSNDTNFLSDAFRFDRLAPAYTGIALASVGPGGVQGDDQTGDLTSNFDAAGEIAISSTGQFVAFQSRADNLVQLALPDTNYATDVFVRDFGSGMTSMISVNAAGTRSGDGLSQMPAISDNGQYVAFNSASTNLVPGGTTSYSTFLRDTVANITIVASLSSEQVPCIVPCPGGCPLDYKNTSISADGRFVAFESHAANLFPNDGNNTIDVFVRDTQANRTWRVPYDGIGTESDGGSHAPSLSSDGTHIAFSSQATNLVSGDTNGVADVFLASLDSSHFGYCFGDGTGIACPCTSGAPEKGCENSQGTHGALLFALGTSRVSPNDTLVLSASTMTANTTVLFFQGTTQVQVVFGDGIRCSGGTVIRLGQRAVPVSGALAFGHNVGTDPDVSLAGFVTPGTTYTYQAWYRNAAGYCTANTYNLSNGLSMTWQP